jgi:hypothetical protein
MVTIETYRGFEIYFNPNSENFSCIPSEENAKESKSYSACKMHIDQYLKDNQNFKPFVVQLHPKNYRWNGDKKELKIIGIRKDNRFIYENNGEKKQLSEYNEKNYFIVYPENEHYIKEYIASELRESEYSSKEKAVREEIISKLNIKTLVDFKKELLGK